MLSKWEIETILKALKGGKLFIISKQIENNKYNASDMVDYDNFVKMEERLDLLKSEMPSNPFD